jgi:penicillin-binding protein 2
MNTQDENIAFLQRKVPYLLLALFVFFVIVVARLFYLQVAQGEHYQKLATEIFIREEEIVARRGLIIDRTGKPLADTRTYYEIGLIPQYIDNKAEVVASLVKLLPFNKNEILEKLNKARFEPKFRPVVIAPDADYDWVVKLKEYLNRDYTKMGYNLSGVTVRSIPVRRYLHPEIFAHALGYLKEIDQKELDRAKKNMPGVFSLGDLTGASGIEKAYDIELKGSDGVIGLVVDARGREITQTDDLKVLQQQVSKMPVGGGTLRTTLDFQTQALTSELFKGKMGAAVALNPQTGEVIVLYSSPGFDANRITKKVDKKYWQLINLHENKYLFNRAIQAMYPPASTYKAVTLTAGIDTGVVDPENTKHVCRGGLRFGNRFFKCWKHSGHGVVNYLRSLGQSCDVFFYQVGSSLGIDRLAGYARRFGLGKKTGIEIPYEQAGLVPSSEWKKRRYKQDWIASETLSVSIGQSYNLVTPLQNAVMVAMVANGGYKVTPHLGKEIIGLDGKVIRRIAYDKQKTDLVGVPALEFVKKGMIEVVHGAGTAKRLRKSPYKIAGKTGTAQVVGHGSKVKKGVKTEPHALFVAFAPYDNPKIAVSIIVEHGRGGSSTAAPIAMQIIDTYLSSL